MKYVVRKIERSELFRKLIHMSGFTVPFIARSIGVAYTSLIILAVTALYAVSELLRLKGYSFPIITTITLSAAREQEIKSYMWKPVYFALGILIPLLIFPKPINYATITILTLGDGVASLAGKLVGGIQLPFNLRKTFEGTLTGFLFALTGAMTFVSPFLAVIGAVAGMAVEGLPLRIDDNLTVALGSGFAMVLASLI
jgi:dolichol kinase